MAGWLSLPAVPPASGWHPLLVHFPIVLLLLPPLALVVGLLWKSRRRCLLGVGLVLMILGALSAHVAVVTGHRAAAEVEMPEAGPVLELHAELAETVRLVFSALALVYLALNLLPVLLRRPWSPAGEIVANLVFLAFYGWGLLLLLQTAFQGGRLVHQFGVLAAM